MLLSRLSKVERSSLWGIAVGSNIGASTALENYIRFAHQSKMLRDYLRDVKQSNLEMFLDDFENINNRFTYFCIQIDEIIMLGEMVVGARIIDEINQTFEKSQLSTSTLYVLAVCAMVGKEDLQPKSTGVNKFNKERILQKSTESTRKK